MHGLLPPIILSQKSQMERVQHAYRRIESELDRYSFLIDLQERNEKLFYRVVQEDIENLMPIIYTPTVGQACLQYGNIFRRARFVIKHV